MGTDCGIEHRPSFLACFLVVTVAVLSAAADPEPTAAIDICAESYCADLILQFFGAGSAHAVDDLGQIDCTWNGSSATGTCSTTYVWSHLISSLDVTVTMTPSSTSYVCYVDCRSLGQPFVQALTLTPGHGFTNTYQVYPARTATLHMTASGDGNGRVTSSPSGIDCVVTAGVGTGTCSHTWMVAADPITVRITATPNAGNSVCLGTFGDPKADCDTVGTAGTYDDVIQSGAETSLAVKFTKAHPS